MSGALTTHRGGTAASAIVLNGADASKPSAAVAGRLYFANDTGICYRDNGSSWVAVSPLQSAGLAPTADGAEGYDTTRKMYVGGGGTFAGLGSFPRVISAQFSTTDQLVAATVNTTETAFATSLALPANFFIANKILLVMASFEYTGSATAVTALIKMRLQKAGPVNVVLYTGSAAATNNAAGFGLGMVWIIQGTAAAGAAVNVMTGSLAPSPGIANIMGANKTPQVAGVAVATNAAQTLQFTNTFGGNTAGNTMNLTELIALEMN